MPLKIDDPDENSMVFLFSSNLSSSRNFSKALFLSPIDTLSLIG